MNFPGHLPVAKGRLSSGYARTGRQSIARLFCGGVALLRRRLNVALSRRVKHAGLWARKAIWHRMEAPSRAMDSQ